MIKVDNLFFEYPNNIALNDISFVIPKNSITALVGPNGSGKTTLLKCLSALISPFSGSITINGIDIIEHPTICKKMVGFLQDFFGLYDNLSIEQAFTYFAHAQMLPKNLIKSRIQEIAEKLNLNEKLNERIGSLSRGMRQRVAIGQSLLHNPQVLFLDEPASGLDPEARYSLSQLFCELNNSGMTLVVSSHILAELNDYAKDIIVLRNGIIVEKKIETSQIHKKNIVISVLNRDDRFFNILENIPFVANITAIDSKFVAFDFSGSEVEQTNLLKEIINQNYQLTEFFEKKESIQEQYLNIVKG